jgi:5-methyltetrahydropteroyltriglutamate--homocysteine methyltransferase
MVRFSTSTLGFGRMGPNRELKFALEKYWKGDLSVDELVSVANEVEVLAWRLQSDAGIKKITVGDCCLYDNVASWAEFLGIIPERFSHLEPGIDRMFAMCRGVDGATALSKSSTNSFLCTVVLCIISYNLCPSMALFLLQV